MAISAIMAAVSTGFTALSGGALLGGFLVAGGVGTMFTHFLITTAMGAALNALTPKPNFGAASGGYSLQGQTGAALDHQIIYGETRVGGVRIYDASTGNNNNNLNRIIAFAGHEIDSYQEIYLNDEVIDLSGASVTVPERYDGKVTIAQYLGTTTQTADTGLITETEDLADNAGKWTSAHRLQGIAYLYTKFVYDADAFPNGVPAVSAVIRGKKVYDPRDTNQDVDDETTWVWSDNPALCLRDYLTSEYGLNQPADRIDDSLVIAAANICDQTVEGEKRYTCNGAFTTNAEPAAVATNILSSMGGLLWYGQGKWRMKAAAWTAPTVSFTEDDLRSSISLSTRHSRRDNFNSVKGTFRSADSDWQPADYPEVTDPAFLTADNNLVNVLDFPLAFTSSDLTAQRIARIALNRNREQLTFSASFGMRAFQVQVGDFINITNERFGFVNKSFEVTEWTFGLTEGLDIQVRMTLREISEGVFTGVDGVAFEQNNTTLPNPFTGLEVNNLTVSGGGRTQGDGTFINSALLSWDSVSNAFTSYYEIEWKPVADSSYASTTTTETSIELSPLIDRVFDEDTQEFVAAEYAFRVRAVSALGNKGPITSALFTVGGDTSAPNVPTSLTATGDLGFINLSWVSPSDVDLNYTEIFESPNNQLSSAVEIAQSFGNTFNRGNLAPLTTRFYFVRSVDFSGNKSDFVGPEFATTRQIEIGDIGPAVIQYDDFASDVIELFDDIEINFNGIADNIGQLEDDIESNFNSIESNIGQLEDDTIALDADVTTLQSQYTTLDGSVTANTTAISGIETRVTSAEGSITANSSSITSLQSNLTTLDGTVNGQATAISGLDTRVTSAEGSITANSSSITSLQSNLTNTNTNVTANATAISGLDTRVTSTEGSITANSSSITSLQSNLTNTNTNVTANATAISGLDTRVTSTEGSITANSSSITSLQSDLTTLDGTVGGQATAISGLDTRVTDAEGDITAQASAITSLSTTVGTNTTSITQVAQSVDGVEGKFGVTIDNNGAATGFQLLSGVGGSAFNVRADQFAVFNSTGAGGDNPFTVFTSSRTIDGVNYPAGTYIQDAYIDNAAIVDLSVDTIKIKNGAVSSGERYFQTPANCFASDENLFGERFGNTIFATPINGSFGDRFMILCESQQVKLSNWNTGSHYFRLITILNGVSFSATDFNYSANSTSYGGIHWGGLFNANFLQSATLDVRFYTNNPTVNSAQLDGLRVSILKLER